MRILLGALMILLPLAGYCGKGDLKGSWREVKRWSTDNKTVGFADTMLIDFLVGNEFTFQKQGGFIHRGSYKREGDGLDIGLRYFTVMEQKGNKLVLRDDLGTYEFAPYKRQQPNLEVVQQENFAPVRNITQMTGHWSKYKGTSSKTVENVDHSRAVKMIDIFSEPKDGKWGYVYAGNDAENAPSWYIESYSNQTLHCNGKDARQLKVIKCENNDLIIEGEGNTYFMRKFK